MKIRTSQVGNSQTHASGNAGFTLIEVLAVLVIIAMTAASISTLYSSQSGGAQLKTAALLAASRLRDVRAKAMTSGAESLAAIDVGGHTMQFSDGSAPVAFARSMKIEVMSADSENRDPSVAGIRFYPNGSSTGGTINLEMEGRAYEIRVNWLTGRVSTTALN